MEQLLHTLKNMRILIYFFLICFIMSQNCLNAINLRGGYNIQKSEGKTETFRENFSAFKTFQPTKRISISSSLRYTKTKNSTHKTETITPTATLNLSNDIFTLDMSGTISETRDTMRNDLSSNLLNISFSSFYKKIVDFKFTYTKSNSKDNGAPHKINSNSKNFGITLKRTFFNHLSFTYDFKKNNYNNKVNYSKITNYLNTFIASLNTLSFRKDKFSAMFSSNFNYKKNKSKSSVFQKGLARFPIPVNILWNNNWNENEKFLKKGEFVKITVPIQGIDIIYFYTDTIFQEIAPTSVFWNIYWSETGDDNSWELLYSNVSLPFKFSDRFTKKGYLKLEIVDTSDQQVEIDSPYFECYLLVKTDKNYAILKTFSRSFSSTYSMQYNFSQKLSSLYNINFSLNNPSPGFKVKTVSHSITTRYMVNKFFSPSFLLSQNIKYNENSADTSNIDFSITNTSNILETLTTNFSYSKSLNYNNFKKTTSMDVYTLSINAKIFPDLNTRWSNSFTNTKTYSNKSSTKTYTSTMGIVARFTPSLTLTSNYSYTQNITPNNSIDQRVDINIAWRISEIMFINIGENITLPDSGKKTYNHNLSFWIAPTKKTQYNFSYAGSIAETRSNTFSNFFSWKINKNFSLKLAFNIQFQEGEHQWDSYANVNFTF